MKFNNSKIKDNFQKQLQTFKMLLVGSIMAKASCLVLIFVSLGVMYQSRNHILEVLLLFTGISSLGFYMFRYLSLKDIKQKSYTQTSFVSSILKFKNYMKNRKKYEMYFMGFWMLSLLPFVISFLKSTPQAILITILYIAVIAIFGNLAYKKTDKIIEELEIEMEKAFHV